MAVRDRDDVGIAGVPVQQGHLAHNVTVGELRQFNPIPAHDRPAAPEKIQAVARVPRANKSLPSRDLAVRQPGAQLDGVGGSDLAPEIKYGCGG